ncbi:MAG: alpha/beta hydrolase [Streptococcaceae bacterium]|nr:alpha/beta hydrolase [Streptococcaceae bacterium]
MRKVENLIMSDGRTTRVVIASPENPRGVVQYLHGYSEHIDLDDVIKLQDFYNSIGFVFVMHEQYGFGLMPELTTKEREKQQGTAKYYKTYIEDAKLIYEHIQINYAHLPVVLHAFSMGGNIGINLLLSGFTPYERVILECPWLQLSKKLPKVFAKVPNFLDRHIPNLKVDMQMAQKLVNRRNRNFTFDELAHAKTSIRFYAMMRQKGIYALHHSHLIEQPTLLFEAENDEVVSTDAIEYFASKAKDNIQFIKINEASHVIHGNEYAKKEFQIIADFLAHIKNDDNKQII